MAAHTILPYEAAAMPTFPFFDRGQIRNMTGPLWTAQATETPASGPASDSEPSFADAAWFFKIALEERLSSGASFETLLSESNEELATLVREVHAPCDTQRGSTPQNQACNELLMRAIHCALKQHVLQAKLGNLALTDELTGLYNRRGFVCLSEMQLKLARRSGRDMVLFFIDVDGLKQINDSFGHCEGDTALVRTAEVLRMTFRKSDVLARLGGDEFGALAIEAPGYSRAAILARLFKNLETVCARELRYPLSLSVGFAQLTFEKGSIADLMLHADQAMYRAKRDQRKPRNHTATKDSPEVIPITAAGRADAMQNAQPDSILRGSSGFTGQAGLPA
jgi:diguanylate cyclase (GGDEF)-like protein